MPRRRPPPTAISLRRRPRRGAPSSTAPTPSEGLLVDRNAGVPPPESPPDRGALRAALRDPHVAAGGSGPLSTTGSKPVSGNVRSDQDVRARAYAGPRLARRSQVAVVGAATGAILLYGPSRTAHSSIGLEGASPRPPGTSDQLPVATATATQAVQEAPFASASAPPATPARPLASSHPVVTKQKPCVEPVPAATPARPCERPLRARRWVAARSSLSSTATATSTSNKIADRQSEDHGQRANPGPPAARQHPARILASAGAARRLGAGRRGARGRPGRRVHRRERAVARPSQAGQAPRRSPRARHVRRVDLLGGHPAGLPRPHRQRECSRSPASSFAPRTPPDRT